MSTEPQPAETGPPIEMAEGIQPIPALVELMRDRDGPCVMVAASPQGFTFSTPHTVDNVVTWWAFDVPIDDVGPSELLGVIRRGLMMRWLRKAIEDGELIQTKPPQILGAMSRRARAIADNPEGYRLDYVANDLLNGSWVRDEDR